MPGGWTLVHPGLPALAVLEPAVSTANGHVEDEVEVLVEGRRVVAGLTPRIHKPRPVGRGHWEIATLPEGFVEICVQDLQQASVDVREQVLLAPLEAEGVERLAKCGVQGIALDVRPPPGVVGGVGAPVQRG